MVDYSQNTDNVSDQDHGDDFFKYGHIGNYNTISRNSYEPFSREGRPINVTDLVQNGNNEEVEVSYSPSDFNSSAAAITSAYFSGFPSEELTSVQLYNILNNPLVQANQFASDVFQGNSIYGSLNNVENGGGILNGQIIDQTYDLWNYLGTPANTFQKNYESQIRFSGSGSADVGNHAIQVGFEYEQRKDAFYGLSPVGLWTIARSRINSHLDQINVNDIEGVYNSGSTTYTTYNLSLIHI